MMFNHRAGEPLNDIAQLADDFTRIAQYDHSVSIPELGSLFRFDPMTHLGKDQQRLAEMYGVPFAWPSTNGTTSLNTMALMTLVSPGDTILCQRDSHVSIFAPMIHLGLRPVYLQPPFSYRLGINLGVTPDQLCEALDQHPEIRAVFLTYPNYFGIATDIQACARVVHERGIPLIVDAAHGAHFQFHPELPISAEETVATIVTQSTHKTCTALSQGSLALIKDESVIDRWYDVVNHLGFVSTSFSYPILQSIMLAVLQLELQGETLLGRAMEVSAWVRSEVNTIDGLYCFGVERAQAGFVALDPLRVTVDVSGLGRTGFMIEDILIREFRIYPELATLNHVLFLFTLVDDWDEGRRVIEALSAIRRSEGRGRATYDLHPPNIPRQCLLPRDVFYSKQLRRLPVREAIGRISAETIATYPPGSPVIVAGEEVTDDHVAFLHAVEAHGGVLKGASDPHLTTMVIVDDSVRVLVAAGAGYNQR
jgi:arginine/lysine/ornithine decarboxylase